jgi:Outer membrane protein beta-barrel domain
MKLQTVSVVGIILLSGMAAWAQEFPRVDVGGNYSYARFAPSAPYSQGHSINGGGGELNFNINEFLGIKMDLQGFTSNTTAFNIAPNATFPAGAHGSVQGNLFTYLFGPQIKVRTHHLQPYAQLLFGGAHTNVYGNAFHTICQPIAGGCTVSKGPTAEAFAMEFGGGVDIPVGKHFAIRPAEVDYLLTRFSNVFTGASNQNNFRYSAGLLFSFGHTHY